MPDTTIPTVLVVDDDPDDMAFTIRGLRKSRLALNCVEAISGEEALAYLRTSQKVPALALVDLKMPGMSGIDTLKRVRADARLSRMPIVIVTNSTLDSDRDKAMAAGADDFLQKAFDLKRYAMEIEARLDRWVQ